MARRSRSRTDGLDDLARRLKVLANSIPDEVQNALDDTAQDSLERMERPFNEAIEGGPAPFSKLDANQRLRSSVVASRRRNGATKGVAESHIRVQRAQSSYFRFHLDGQRQRKDDDRRPGEVGVAEKHNFIPTHNLLKWQGIKPTSQGNLPRGALKLLFRRARNGAQVQADADRQARKKHAKRLGLSPDDERIDELMANRKRRKRKAPERGARDDIFFGVPKGRPKTRRGFWQRPAEGHWQLIALVHAEPKSNYGKSEKMQAAWNVGVLGASNASVGRVEKAVERAIERSSKR